MPTVPRQKAAPLPAAAELPAHDADERTRSEEILAEQARELAAANQRKSHFLVMLGHELRDPLGAISSALALAEEADGDAEVQREALGIIRRQNEQIARLVDDLLEVARAGRGLIELERSHVDLRTIVEHAVESVQPRIEARGQRLAVDVGGQPIPVFADPLRLGQVVSNLLGNASKYSDDGGRIWLRARRAGERAELRVRDEGVGIEPEFLPQVFELFAQGAAESDPQAPGLGIGLTLVRQLVELHGGRVEARSEGRGRGSELRVALPLAPGSSDAAEESSPAATRDHTAGRRLRVLLVDDHEEAVTALHGLLEIWGHDVRTARDGPSALEIARELAPQLVLLDIGLPEMDGWEVARRLRERPETASATLVALTGYGQDTARARSRDAGFDHHLVKPVDPQELKERLAEWL